MAAVIPPDFELSLQIALRMVEQGPRLDYSAKLPDKRDRGSARIAAQLVEQLRLQGWKIEAPPPPQLPLNR